MRNRVRDSNGQKIACGNCCYLLKLVEGREPDILQMGAIEMRVETEAEWKPNAGGVYSGADQVGENRAGGSTSVLLYVGRYTCDSLVEGSRAQECRLLLVSKVDCAERM